MKRLKINWETLFNQKQMLLGCQFEWLMGDEVFKKGMIKRYPYLREM